MLSAGSGTASEDSLDSAHALIFIVCPSRVQAHSSGTDIHSPVVSHRLCPVNKGILVACIMIPVDAEQTATIVVTPAWLVAMSSA
jgi:hypothetical protein